MTLTNPDKDTLGVLIEEYKLHRQEVLQNLSAYYGQSSYIQIYAVLIFGIAAIVYNLGYDLSSIGNGLKIGVLLIGLFIILYFMSSVMVYSYTILVLRKRMSFVEYRINEILSRDVLQYESIIAPALFEKPAYEGKISPHVLSGLWRLSLIWTVLLTLCGLSLSINSGILSFAYITLSISLMTFATNEYIQMISESTGGVIDRIVRGERAKSSLLRPLYYLLVTFTNVFIAALIVWFYFFSEYPYILSNLSINIFATYDGSSQASILTASGMYNLLCAIFLPTPSEAPLIFVKAVSFWKIALACAVGKALGSIVLAVLVGLFAGSRRFTRVLEPISKGRGLKLTIWSLPLRYGYLVFQSTPFAPMRSSTVLYAWLVGISWRSLGWIGLASGLGTFVRISVMWSFIKLGLATMQWIPGA